MIVLSHETRALGQHFGALNHRKLQRICKNLSYLRLHKLVIFMLDQTLENLPLTSCHLATKALAILSTREIERTIHVKVFGLKFRNSHHLLSALFAQVFHDFGLCRLFGDVDHLVCKKLRCVKCLFGVFFGNRFFQEKDWWFFLLKNGFIKVASFAEIFATTTTTPTYKTFEGGSLGVWISGALVGGRLCERTTPQLAYGRS